MIQLAAKRLGGIDRTYGLLKRPFRETGSIWCSQAGCRGHLCARCWLDLTAIEADDDYDNDNDNDNDSSLGQE